MNFELTEHEQERVRGFKRFCEENVSPASGVLGEKGVAAGALLRDVLARLGEVGYPGLCLPSDWGGGGGELILQAVWNETLAAVCPTTHLFAYTSGPHCGNLIARFGTGEQKSGILEGLARGTAVAAIARTERQGGSDPEGMNTVARKESGGYVLDGEKSFCVNGPVADWFLTFARLQDGGGRQDGFGCFLVPADAPGVDVGEAFQTMGFVGLPVATVRFRAVRLGEGGLLGAPADGTRLYRESSNWDAMGAAAGSIGIMEACLEAAFGYAEERVVSGRPIGRYQEVSFKLAEIRAMLDTARLLHRSAAWSKQAEDPGASVLISCAKLFASESAAESARHALQVFGAAGLRKGSRVERLYRDAKTYEIGGGTSEAHRIRIARAILESV